MPFDTVADIDPVSAPAVVTVAEVGSCPTSALDVVAAALVDASCAESFLSTAGSSVSEGEVSSAVSDPLTALSSSGAVVGGEGSTSVSAGSSSEAASDVGSGSAAGGVSESLSDPDAESDEADDDPDSPDDPEEDDEDEEAESEAAPEDDVVSSANATP